MGGRRQITPTEDLRRRMAIKRANGNVTHAARELGMPAPTLQRFAMRYGLSKGRGSNTQLPLKEVMRRVEAWLKHGSDRLAAASLIDPKTGRPMKVFTFTRWRVRHHLPGKNYKGKRL